MIILWIACFIMAIVMVLAGIGSAFKGNIFSGFFWVFFGVIGGLGSAGSIYSEINPKYKAELDEAKEITFQKEIKECQPQYKMIKEPFYGNSYTIFCLDSKELNVSEKQYNSIQIEAKSYEKTDLDKNIHLVIMAFFMIVVVPALFFTYKYLFLY